MEYSKEYIKTKPQRGKKKFSREAIFEKYFKRANLFAFVANFVKSKKTLIQLIKKFPDKTEAYLRLVDMVFLGDSVDSSLEELKNLRRQESFHAVNYDLAILLIELRVFFSKNTKSYLIPCQYVGPYFSIEKSFGSVLTDSVSTLSTENKNSPFKELSYIPSDKLTKIERSPVFADDNYID